MVNLLNSYFGAVAEVIHAHHGVIDKYIGDAVMAFWIPPFSAGDDHARDACLAALAQLEAVAALRAQLPEITGMRRNPPKLAIRIGIASGEAVVGTIGSPTSRSYTVIGDTVNLAARLESVNRLYGSTIILSEETYRLAQQVIEVRELDLITVVGKTEPVRIYEAMGRAGELGPEASKLCELFAQGLAAYRGRIGTRLRATSRAASPSQRRTDHRATSLNASLSCVAPPRRPIGMGFGGLPISEAVLLSRVRTVSSAQISSDDTRLQCYKKLAPRQPRQADDQRPALPHWPPSVRARRPSSARLMSVDE